MDKQIIVKPPFVSAEEFLEMHSRYLSLYKGIILKRTETTEEEKTEYRKMLVSILDRESQLTTGGRLVEVLTDNRRVPEAMANIDLSDTVPSGHESRWIYYFPGIQSEGVSCVM